MEFRNSFDMLNFCFDRVQFSAGFNAILRLKMDISILRRLFELPHNLYSSSWKFSQHQKLVLESLASFVGRIQSIFRWELTISRMIYLRPLETNKQTNIWKWIGNYDEKSSTEISDGNGYGLCIATSQRRIPGQFIPSITFLVFSVHFFWHIV